MVIAKNHKRFEMFTNEELKEIMRSIDNLETVKTIREQIAYNNILPETDDFEYPNPCDEDHML